ncbi:MAG: hypothetical protein LBT88_01230 [Oscillospiraceae bacterium]|jgi:hypothetical protein|nr:hypothetical protein [Oscillospiraceae bacterium]
MFTGGVFFFPGQELREFDVLRPNARETENGRIVNNGYTSAGKITAILAAAKPEEKERWRQLEHPITHKIIQQHTPAFEIKAGDVFERAGRHFYNQAMPYNVGDISHWTIYYCEEREDL